MYTWQVTCYVAAFVLFVAFMAFGLCVLFQSGKDSYRVPNGAIVGFSIALVLAFGCLITGILSGGSIEHHRWVNHCHSQGNIIQKDVCVAPGSRVVDIYNS